MLYKNLLRRRKMAVQVRRHGGEGSYVSGRLRGGPGHEHARTLQSCAGRVRGKAARPRACTVLEAGVRLRERGRAREHVAVVAHARMQGQGTMGDLTSERSVVKWAMWDLAVFLRE